MRLNATKCLLVLVICLTSLIVPSSRGALALSGTFTAIPKGALVDLSTNGSLDWVHWGLYTETSLDRKANVVPQISDYTVLYQTNDINAYAFAYQYSDNYNGYSWSDGTPTAVVTNTTTGVWTYGTPILGSGFEITAPADTATRTLKVYVGVYAGTGKLEAYLSDGSARGYTNSTLRNMTNVPGGFYSITYSAGSAGQQLFVHWTLDMFDRADGNVTLQAAALSSTNANNPPFVMLTSPVEDAKFSAGGNITLTANAADSGGGNVAKVEFFAGATKLGEDTASPYSLTWSNVPAGFYILSATATDNQGVTSVSAPVEVFVSGTGGSLGSSLTVPPSLPTALNLTAEGQRDWTHWGLTTNNFFDHKANVVQQISDLTKLGTNVVERYGDNHTGYSWSDGTPTASTNGTTTGVFITGVTNGFEITVPADTTSRTLKIYLGLYGAQANFQAWLSDFSSPAYTDTTLSNFFGNSYAVYTVTYAAASSGQALTVRYRSLKLFDQDFGNVTLQAATLVVNTSGNASPDVSIISPTNATVLAAPASFTLQATASDSDGSVNQVEFFNGNTSLGVDTTNPYSAPVSSLAAGSYILSAVATDNLGAKATNSITISVTNSPALPVTLLNPSLSGSNFVFSFASQSGHSYEVDYSGILGSGDWQVLTNLIGTGSMLSVTNRNVPATQRFYRIQTQ